ncbi:hypothetical protein MMC12_008210, partial [Toensbergia leucococca]|nr:hypothetical protein [Toensbergia leucococca]
APVYRLPSPPISSRQLPSYQAVDEPSATLSFTEIIVGYGDRDSGGVDVKRTSTSSGSQYSSKSPRRNIISQIGESSESQNKHTQIMAQKTSSIPGLQSNLRFGALMTSRWLSFGRVLFSPAHSEIKNNRQDRVLVLDGLGNDDWSFYCALTYPDATVYSLSSVQSKITSLTKNRELEAYQSPSNHRQIHHASITHPFPFPKGFFTAVIFRFPVVSSEAVYQYAISECKRVLRPGGYLEMSVLDLDMVKMGNRARRAIRDLKVRMQIADPQVSLKPVSDNIQKMLGRRGFENLNRCMLEVPVAGRISNSRAGSFDEKDLSLGDMLRDRSQQGDEDITKMVAKVGRWWYSRCYEMSVLPDEDLEKSIWADKALLRECVKWETGFKLLICYAQKPLAPRRRTVSV